MKTRKERRIKKYTNEPGGVGDPPAPKKQRKTCKKHKKVVGQNCKQNEKILRKNCIK